MSLLRKEILKNAGKLGISSLNSFQTQAISKIFSNKNTVLLGEPGIGKTLTYIFAISSLTSLLPCTPSQKFSYTSLFTPAPKPDPISRPHGSLIILPTHEKCSEVYQKFRIIAPWLNIKRVTSSMSSFIGTFLLPPDNFSNSEELESEGLKNIVQGVEWERTDVLLATPASLQEFMNCRQELSMSGINPAHIVIDEIDWIFESGDSCKNLRKSFEYIEDCKEKQFILSSSILPYSGISPNPLALLNKEFDNLESVSSENWNKIPEDLKITFYESNEEIPKMQTLAKILDEKKAEKILIFSNHISRCSDIKNFCDEHGIESIMLTPNLSFEERFWEYVTRPETNKVVVGNELACRGFDIKADNVVLYNLPQSVSSMINRIGTVKKTGSVSVFLENDEEKIKEFFKPGESWESLFQYFPQNKNKKIHSLFPE